MGIKDLATRISGLWRNHDHEATYVENGNGKLVQEIGDGQRVVHDSARLVGVDPQLRIGSNVEIRYPHGEVGLVQKAVEIQGLAKGIERAHNDYGF